MLGSIDSIESMGLVDGPGIRTVIFLNGCKLRCKYCHNPEMWTMKKENMTVEELVQKILRFKPYYGTKGGVTFSGGEPLLQIDFLIAVCKRLKEENIHIALDTAGVGIGKYEELLQLVDLVILDIKDVTKRGYLDLTGYEIEESLKFMTILNNLKKPIWIRQVIIPNVNDNIEYLKNLKTFLKQLPNIEKIDFLPYHKLGSEKYEKLNMVNPYKDRPEMSKERCEELYQTFLKI